METFLAGYAVLIVVSGLFISVADKELTGLIIEALGKGWSEIFD